MKEIKILRKELFKNLDVRIALFETPEERMEEWGKNRDHVDLYQDGVTDGYKKGYLDALRDLERRDKLNDKKTF